MGLGLHGGGVAAAYWFFRQGAEVIITDIKKRHELEPSIARLTALCTTYRLSHPAARLSSCEYVLGEHREKDILGAEYVIQNPGVPREMPLLALAREKGIPIHNDASIFFSLLRDADIIGVTGTRGKTTTVLLIAGLLKRKYPMTLAAGYATRAGAVSFFSILDKAFEQERAGVRAPIVLELSSWQLEMLATHALSPRLAVMTNMYPDHLNRHVSMEAYVEAKKNIYRFQDGAGCVIANYDNPLTRAMGDSIPSPRRYWFSRSCDGIDRGACISKKRTRTHRELILRGDGADVAVCPCSASALRGGHNEENMLAALVVGMIRGVSPEAMREFCASAQGVQGRLEYLGLGHGRAFYNDTTATSPDAVCAALKTLGGRSKKIILIAGGADKGLDFSGMGGAIARYCKALVLLSGTATPSLFESARTASYGGAVFFANSMSEAVGKAWQASKKGDILLLSPGAASFGMFRHEFDRGDQFVQAVERLMNSGK